MLRNDDIYESISDLRNIPLQDHSMDIVMAGWSICYLSSSSHHDWNKNLFEVMDEIERILKPNGTILILETIGTGKKKIRCESFRNVRGFGGEFKDRLNRKAGDTTWSQNELLPREQWTTFMTA